MKKVTIFTNIPAPYRIALFNDLEKVRKINNYNFDFVAYFMRITESNRNWKINIYDMKFKYRIGKGLYIPLRTMFIHFNPILLIQTIKNNNEIILGASWNNMNVLLIIILKRFNIIDNTLSIWSEANYLTINSKKKNKFRDYLRNYVFNTIDGSFIVPGKMSLLSFEKWNILPKNTIILPNLVSKEIFSLDKRTKKNNKIPVFIIVARLNERLKGILNFINSIGIENVKKIKIKIIGEGESKNEYIKYINKNKLNNNIYLLGGMDQAGVSREYDNADVFVLPSYSDPSPLTVIEAVNKGLPLLLSNRCGNHYEAVEIGQNGFIFDPYNPSDIKLKFEEMLGKRMEWSNFSVKSNRIADEKFDNETVLKKFIEHFSHNDTY